MLQRLVPFSSTPFAFQKLQANFQPKVLIASASAGLVTGIIGTIRAISYASLIFSGALALQLPIGLGITIFSTAITLAVVALTSTLPGIIATPLAAPTAILAIMAAGIAEELPQVTTQELLATVLVMIALSALLTGGLLLLLGLYKQGERLRVIPYPVIGGFMAGTGWLLTRGFVQITTDIPLTWSSLDLLAAPSMLWCWLPGVGFAIALLIASRLWQQFWVMPITLMACAGAFYLMLGVTGISMGTARTAGWLLGPFPQGDQLWQPVTLELFYQVHWLAILHQSGGILTVMLISLISLMLSNSSIELVIGQDLNLSHELKAIGLANVVSSLGGGMMGNQAFPSTLLVHNIGATYRLTGLFATIPAIAVLALGSSFLSYLPKALLGSVILYLGLSLLWKWLYQAYFKLPLWDYLIVWVTLIVINTLGFLQGILTGFVITVILFMVTYSQVDVARQVFSGSNTRSNVDRSPEAQGILSQQGDQIYVLELQGFLFFGTANYLLNKVRNRAKAQSDQIDTSQALRYVIIDFRQVHGLDSSAVLTFDKILKLAHQQHFSLVLTNLLPELQQGLNRGINLDSELCHVFTDIDRGLEWCEQQILSEAIDSIPSPESVPLADQLIQLFLTANQASHFITYLSPQAYPAGHYIFRQGEVHTGLYFIESGQVSVLLEQANGRHKRLQTCTSGHLLGEMRFYSKAPLSTSVVTDMPSQLYYLSQEAFERMQQDAPDLVHALEAYIVRILCDSLLRREQQLQVMQ
ncbi:cyclic nucleotide-binding protein [Leptolyngbya sp. Heron Island J]|uniref:SLC26A/SulP transporter family protein n=1 Tax=Leptolyngbya sp. Heron Island J TaxID=1385935 RepID=UPI0003B94DEF|nr:SulP family inorganic anion transporter [Leptolyngbya sp. Heron Island J]ESA38400.1 cyclic nucleotide-binding protein [Leptolyngbya sp. Heron Island J]